MVPRQGARHHTSMPPRPPPPCVPHTRPFPRLWHLKQNLAASERVIVVEHNYRLGALGFLSLPVGFRSAPAWGRARPVAPSSAAPRGSHRTTTARFHSPHRSSAQRRR